MRILSPITNSEDISVLNPDTYGTEFFFGYLPAWWIKKYNHSTLGATHVLSTPLNNRNDINANVLCADEAIKMIKLAQEKKTKIYLVINAKYYPEYVYDDLRRYFNEIYDMGVRNVICCDLGVINALESMFPDVKVSVSCLNQVTNSKAVKFYSRFGNVDRIVFPRHMSTDEIITISRNNPEFEFEYFIFSNKCMFDDGYCRGLHAFTPICKDELKNTYYCRTTNEVISSIHSDDEMFWKWTQNERDAIENDYCTPNFACTACSLIELVKQKNISAVKLSIRGHNITERLRQVQMARKAIDCAELGNIDGLKNAVCEIYGKEDLCRTGMSCMMI